MPHNGGKNYFYFLLHEPIPIVSNPPPLEEGLALADGLLDAEGETLAEELEDILELGETDADGDTLAEILELGLTLADIEELTEELGDTDPDGEIEAEGLRDADGD